MWCSLATPPRLHVSLVHVLARTASARVLPRSSFTPLHHSLQAFLHLICDSPSREVSTLARPREGFWVSDEGRLGMAASPTELAALEQWFRANHGHLHPGIHLQHDDIFGVHYRTRATIEAGVCVASASHAVALSYLNALVDEHFPVFQQQRHRFPVAAAGFFYLMSQWVNREISFWKAYLDTLPTPEADFSQPLFFEQAADTAWLEGTDVWHTVRAREEVYRSYFNDGIALLRQEGMDVQPYTW